MSQTLRAFVAVDLPRAAVEALAAVQGAVDRHGLSIRWVRPENLHLTLKFLGDLPTDVVDAVARAMDRAVGDAAPLHLTVGGLGVFPGIKRPRVLWAGLHGDTRRLGALHGHLNRALADAGFAPDAKPFRAHLTLGRPRDRIDARGLADAMLQAGTYAPIGLPVEAIALFKSRLTPAGPVYTRLRSAVLAGPAGA
ncbi:MAG: RNA 2',3'-cyclic phosphodiesterase [Desulfobacterales bacterium]|nr:RNA 2',3'-cyclic phosphodiesterase [Desulfobacterales bacterium]